MMANQKAARRYAQAIFELASEAGCAEAVGRDLRVISESIQENAATSEFFRSPVVDRKEKERVLSAAFGGNAHDVAVQALLLLVRKRRESLLGEIVHQYEALEQQSRGAEPLTITSAKPLSASELRAMTQRLEAIYGRHFEVTQEVDPQLIGGVRIMMGDRRVDGSIEGRLQEFSRALFARN